MKKLILPIFLVFLLSACQTETQESDNTAEEMSSEGGFYGEEFNTNDAIPASALMDKMGSSDKMEATIEGEVAEVCKQEGCWLKVSTGGEPLMVKMKNHEFFVPKDIDGKKVIIKGVAERETTSVEELKHYAQDAGKSQEEIDAINEPETEVVFIASGVKLI